MKAILRSVRIAPKKVNIIAKMVRGMSVPVAVEALRRTNKKAARIVEDLLRSAIANASHNDKQDPQMMVIRTIVVNQGTAYRRGMPKARGQMRPYRKFLSHVTVELGFPDLEKGNRDSESGNRGKKAAKSSDSSSQSAKSAVQKKSSRTRAAAGKNSDVPVSS